MRRSVVFICTLFALWISGQRSAIAQAVEAMDGRGFYINAGGMGSGFLPGDWNQAVIGGGTYVDVHFTHWFQVEAEGRWMRWNGYYGETQDNYLIGPRVPVYRFGRRNQIYGKALVGLAKQNFAFGGYGSFTAFAFGGSYDYKLTRKLTLRPVDFEYQYWPVWLPHKSLQPYGVSIGASYRVF
jgi:hypothetical protein